MFDNRSQVSIELFHAADQGMLPTPFVALLAPLSTRPLTVSPYTLLPSSVKGSQTSGTVQYIFADLFAEFV
jgi:hypothetical protein